MIAGRAVPPSADVVIVGAGPVGLAAAIELGRRGVRCLVAERNDRVGYSPRAKTTNVRSRTHLRRWGIAGALRRASPIPPDYPPRIVFATRMTGAPLGEFANAFNGARLRNDLYPEEAQWVPQYTVEEVLRAHAASLPAVTLCFDTVWLDAEERPDGLAVTLRHGGAEHRVGCAYLIGADGARSAVCERIGARMESLGPALPNVSIIFRAPDLARRHGLGQAIMYWLVNGDAPAVLGPMDQDGAWTLMATQFPEGTDFGASFDAAGYVRRSTGLPDLAVEVLSVDPWLARQMVADRYARGSMFLAGDACHLHPPFGGFGMNMGIGDAVDLGWKIAARLQGWGGDGLLAAYERERRPVHLRTIREAANNYAATGTQLAKPGIEAPGPQGDATRREVGELVEATKRREFKTLGLVLGYHYAGSPLVVSDGTAPPHEDATVYTPSASPGCLAPHLWLGDGSSLYDHFGDGFTLLATAPADTAPLEAAASRRGVPLTTARPGDARLTQRYEARLALIRPDQHVAWRGDTLPADVDTLLATVTGAASAPAPMREKAAAD